MATYSIHPNSHRIDKTNFPTKDEAISRAQECARVLNRGVSVYEVDEPGTNTQEKDYPKITSPIKHIAFVLPDGTVQKGKHPAIELMEKDPEGGELKTYPYALGKLSALVRTLDTVARHSSLPKEFSDELFTIADLVQNRVFNSQSSVDAALSKLGSAGDTSDDFLDGFIVAFKTGAVFRNSANNTIVKILGYDESSQIVSFISSASTPGSVVKPNQKVAGIQARAPTLAKVLLNSGFEISNQQEAPPATKTMPHIQPVVRTPEDDAKLVKDAEEGKTLSEQLQDSAAGENNTLLSYCMNLCNNDIYAADELATAFLDAFNKKTANRLTTVGQLKVMKAFCGHSLPEDWFVKAQRCALTQLSGYRPNIALVAPVEVRRAAGVALKAAQDKGLKLPRLIKTVSARIAKGDALDLQNLERIHLFLTKQQSKATSSVESVAIEHAAWGGNAGKVWIQGVFNNFPQQAE